MGGAMEKLQLDLDGPDPRRGLSGMARGLIGSEILRIASEIRTAVTAGQKITNFTVGDFSSREFPIPDRLRDGILRALAAGETNYPPSDGVLRLREAVREFWRERLQLEVPLESIVIAGGSRPVIYATYRALVEPGDTVVYPVPSWNNNHYCHLVGAKGVPLETKPEHGFLPTAASLKPLLKTARLIALNTPLNPAGTVLSPEEVLRISQAVIDENRLREHKGRLQQRLDRLHEGFSRMTSSGLPVRDIPPQGAIYLSVQFDLIGKRGFRTNDQVRRYLLDEAGFAVVPFQAFGLSGENGWFRLSVGAVSMRDIDEALPRVEA